MRTDRHDEANSNFFVILRTRLKKKKRKYVRRTYTKSKFCQQNKLARKHVSNIHEYMFCAVTFESSPFNGTYCSIRRAVKGSVSTRLFLKLAQHVPGCKLYGSLYTNICLMLRL
jgi:hypothetical protein